MKTHDSSENAPLVWQVREAKSRLSEVLRRARTDGPQTIGTRNPCMIISKETWNELTEPRVPFTKWLVKNSPGIDFEIPSRGQSADRPSPFDDPSDPE